MKVKLLKILIITMLVQTGIAYSMIKEDENNHYPSIENCMDEKCVEDEYSSDLQVIEYDKESAITLPLRKIKQPDARLIQYPPRKERRWWEFWQATDSKIDEFERQIDRE